MYTKYLISLFNRPTRSRKSVHLITIIICIFLILNAAFFCRIFFASDVSLRIGELPALHHSSLEKLISCYDKTSVEDRLTPVEDIRPGEKSIFFLETSCRGDLDTRQICAVESAAKANPEWNIYVLFLSPIDVQSEKSKATELLAFKNVYLARVNLEEFTRGTPVESLIAGNAFEKSKWPVTHVSDVLRILILYKFGGIYLDLDVVVARSFDSLPKNFGAMESNYDIATGIIGLSKDNVGMNITDLLIRFTVKYFSGDTWTGNGPKALTLVIRQYCNNPDITKITPNNCKGFQLFGPEKFYPLHYSNYKQYFYPGELDVKDAYMYHIWNRMSENMEVYKDSPYSKIASKYCPNTYSNHKINFGMEDDVKMYNTNKHMNHNNYSLEDTV